MRDKNEIIIRDDYAILIILDRKNEPKAKCLISIDKIPLVKDYIWSLTSNGYTFSRTKNSQKGDLIHRLIMNPDKGEVVDHINGNKLDNRNDNLRVCSYSQNLMNAKLKNNNTSGVTGVWYNKKNGKWYAEIFFDGNKKNIGGYLNKKDAITSRREAERVYFGEYSFKGSDSDE